MPSALCLPIRPGRPGHCGPQLHGDHTDASRGGRGGGHSSSDGRTEHLGRQPTLSGPHGTEEPRERSGLGCCLSPFKLPLLPPPSRQMPPTCHTAYRGPVMPSAMKRTHTGVLEGPRPRVKVMVPEVCNYPERTQAEYTRSQLPARPLLGGCALRVGTRIIRCESETPNWKCNS